MKLKLISLTLLMFFTSTSCGKIFSLFSKNLDTEYRTDVKSKYNDNNIVFVEGKEYLYDVTQKESNRVLNFKLSLKTIPGNYNRETKIKYKYFYEESVLNETEKLKYINTSKVKNYKWEITSVDENIDNVTLHHPRSYTLNHMELAPFPKVKIPFNVGDKYSSILFIGPGWGEYTGKRVEWNYEIIEVSPKNTTEEGFLVTIKAISKFKETTESLKNELCKAIFEFDSQLGFTKMSYDFTDSTFVEFLMVK